MTVSVGRCVCICVLFVFSFFLPIKEDEYTRSRCTLVQSLRHPLQNYPPPKDQAAGEGAAEELCGLQGIMDMGGNSGPGWTMAPGWWIPSPTGWDRGTKAERRRYEALYAPIGKHERHPQEMFLGGHTGSLAGPRVSPKPTPRAYYGEHMEWRAPEYAKVRTISPMRTHSPVRAIPAPRKCHARVGIQPGRRMPVQRIWPLVRLLGQGYPTPALRTATIRPLHSPVRPVPALHSCRAAITIQPGRVVQEVRSRPPVLTHGPVYPVPAPRTSLGVRVSSLVPPLPAPRTRPPVRQPSPARPVRAPRTHTHTHISTEHYAEQAAHTQAYTCAHTHTHTHAHIH